MSAINFVTMCHVVGIEMDIGQSRLDDFVMIQHQYVLHSVVTVPIRMELKSVPSSFSKMELKSDPSSAAKMELKSVQDPLILELVPILVPHFSNFFWKGGG